MMMMTTPAILARMSRYSRSSWPMAEAPAPSATKTVEKPSTKTKAAISALREEAFACSSFRAPVSSSRLTPAR